MPLAAKRLIRPAVQSFQKEWTCQLKKPYCVEPWQHLKCFATTVMTGSAHCQSSWYFKGVCTLLAASSELMSMFNSSLFISTLTVRRAPFSLTSKLRLSRGVWRDEILSLERASWGERTADRVEFKAERHLGEAFLRHLLVLSSIGKCANFLFLIMYMLDFFHDCLSCTWGSSLLLFLK